MSQKITFTKMHGLGNDYVYVNCLNTIIEDPSTLAIKISDRHFGIGSDGLVLILPSTVADFRMRMFNADGSESEMCGNASRCIGKYVFDKGLTTKREISLETEAGIKHLAFDIENNAVAQVTVDMGEPILEPKLIPVNSEKPRIVNDNLTILGESLNMTCVSMGNPHAVFFVPEITDHHILELGPKIETNSFFPKRVNVEFIRVINRRELEMRVWERGSGETLACGTGACASVVAAILNNLTERKVLVHLRGGDATIEWNETTNHVLKTGPAVTVFEGEYSSTL